MLPKHNAPFSSTSPSLAFLCDFDGTITLEDLGVGTLQRFARPGWQEFEERWRRQEISTPEAMRAQFALVTATMEDLRAFYANAPVDPHFTPLVEACRRRGAPFVIVSDGLDLYIRPVLERLGLSDLPFHANHAALVDGHFRFDFPGFRPECGRCGNCKRAHIERLRREHARVIFIGDGHSDRCAASHADFVFAKGFLAEHCRAHRIPFQHYRDLGDVRAWLMKNLPS